MRNVRSRAGVWVIAVVLLAALPGLQAGHGGPGTHFGPGNFPEGCTGDFDDDCYHMRVLLNALDTPIIDVLLVPPASPYPERDLRVMRQAVEMWEAGIDYLADQMQLDWLERGVEFNIFLDDGEFTTHPLWDPEIVVVVTNPVGGVGIGIDPPGPKTPCMGPNPLAGFDAWSALPGFDSHHGGHSGTYVEDCPGGGTTCYAVNAAIDPLPGFFPLFGLFNLVAHEIGHCLTIGHVGDALDFSTNEVPMHDIMAYANLLQWKCVSTLDVEGFAVRMSRFLLDEPLLSNDGSYHTQHPIDHFYASSTGSAQDCPRPDLGLVAGPPADFRPAVFRATLEGPAEVETGQPSPFVAAAEHAAGDISCTVFAEGAPLVSDLSADGCAGTLTWSMGGVYLVEATVTDGVHEDDAALDVTTVTYADIPMPDGSLEGSLALMAIAPMPSQSMTQALMWDVDPPAVFLPGQAVRMHSRGTVDHSATPTASSQGDRFTWHVWGVNGTREAVIACSTSPDGPAGEFNCVADTTAPLQAGSYYTTLRHEEDGRWVCDREEPWRGLLPDDAPACLKRFEVAQTP